VLVLEEVPVLIACWSVKGGSGTTVVAASLALLLASSVPGVLLADLAGDAPAVLGLPEPTGEGLYDWFDATADAAALDRLAVQAAPGLSLIPRGRATSFIGAGPGRLDRCEPQERMTALAAALAARSSTCVVDLGVIAPHSAQLAASATTSLLVIRPCYLALRRAVAAPVRPSGVVLVDEPARALGRHDVEDVLGVPVVATVAFDPAVSRAVDAGLLAARLPRQLARSLRPAA
jgi:uncharacterized lipoprotein YbaY